MYTFWEKMYISLLKSRKMYTHISQQKRTLLRILFDVCAKYSISYFSYLREPTSLNASSGSIGLPQT